MLISAETIQKLADRAAEQQRQAGQVMHYRNAGDEETARFLDRPAEQQQTLLARQDLADAVAAAHAGDMQGTIAAATSAVQRQMRGARLMPRRKVR